MVSLFLFSDEKRKSCDGHRLVELVGKVSREWINQTSSLTKNSILIVYMELMMVTRVFNDTIGSRSSWTPDDF